MPFMQFYTLPRALPSGIHKTALKVRTNSIHPSLVPRPSQKEGEGSGEYSTTSHYGLAHLRFHK